MTTSLDVSAAQEPEPERPAVPTFQELLALEDRPVPKLLREESFAEIPVEVSKQRYISREYHDLEVERVWGRVWQFACFEQDIPNPGDVYVYEISRYSLLVTRGNDGEIRAFHNACLHRGTTLCEGDTTVAEFRCPFHGFAWNLDGSFKECPYADDFTHVDFSTLSLPEAKVATWDGFVFLNFDPDCEPFESYIGGMAAHFEDVARPPMKDRWKAVHVAKPVHCNWKVGIEAFHESMHANFTHPQSVLYNGDQSTQYDIWPEEKHWTRMCVPLGVPSSAAAHLTLTEEDIAQALLTDMQLLDTDTDSLELPQGQTARTILAEQARMMISAMTGFDASALTTSEMVDGYFYRLFPNFIVIATIGYPIVFRFRPYNDDPDWCLMEAMLLFPVPPGADRLPATPQQWLNAEQSWTENPTLLLLGSVFDQDCANMPRVQKGLHAMANETILLSRRQESGIRHTHVLLTEYIGK